MDDRSSLDRDSADLSHQTLAKVIAGCQQERSDYRHKRIDESPSCVEVFRRAFAGNQEAWAAVQATFALQVRAWIGGQKVVNPDDAVQEAFLAFFRYAPAHASLVAGHTLGPVVDYLHHCTRTAVLQLLRKERRHALNVYFNETFDYPGVSAIADNVEQRLDLVERLQHLLETEAERIIFQCRFVCNLKPQEIVKLYPERFVDVREVYAVVRRITNRLSHDAVLRELNDLPATFDQKDKQIVSLAMSLLDDTEDGGVNDQPCLLDEAQLLDYITGLATIEVRSMVERSPACLAAARRLAQTVLPLMQQLYRVNCPDEATLVKYKERALAGAEQLVVRAHVATCPLCQEECQLIDMIGADVIEPPSIRRRIVDALRVPMLQLPQALRGQTLLHYQSPNVLINISARARDGKPRTWTLRGEIRALDGLQMTDRLEATMLRSLDQTGQGDRQGEVASNGSFVFRNLPAGAYSLSLLTPEEEIVIRQLSIGDE
jgi:DNA-directed RNA polymerase specialized sigma24 family protein